MKLNVQNIYVVATFDEEHRRMINQVLIQYEKGHPGYLEFFSPCQKKIEREKYERKIKKRLGKWLHLSKEDFASIVFIREEDEVSKQFILKTIGLLKDEKQNRKENVFHFVEISTFLPGTIFHILPLGALSAAFSTLAIRSNLKYQNLPRSSSEGIRKIKFAFSLCLLSMNTIFRIHDFSMNYETMYHQYKLSHDIDDVLSRRKIILDTVDNPFDEEMITFSGEMLTDILMDSLEENPFLKECDLETALKLEQYIHDNPYLDYGNLYDDFSSFGVVDTDLTLGSIGGQKFDEFIIVYDSSNRDLLSYQRILEHELVHRTGHLENSFLNEGMTSLIVYEYMEDFKVTDGYFDQLLVTKILCELITPEKMLEAYSKNNMNIIKNELLKLNPNEENYQAFMELLEQYGKEMKKAAKENRIDEFFQLKGPQFKEALCPFIYSYMGTDVEDKKRFNIVAYLHGIGQQMNIIGDPYFNQAASDSYEKTYLKEKNILSDRF